MRMTFADLCRRSRAGLDISQRELAAATGLSRGYLAVIELGRANPSLDTIERIADALGIELEFISRPPLILGSPQRDVVHAWASGYVDRRIRAAGWHTAREVELAAGRVRGWIDLLAFDPRTGVMVIVEVKTRIDDIGAVERQLGWYERRAFETGRGLGWPVRRAVTWLLLLATDDVERAIRENREVLASAFPIRAPAMAGLLDGGSAAISAGRGLALIDPSSRRADWLIRSRVDGRRSAAPYLDYAHAARCLARSA